MDSTDTEKKEKEVARQIKWEEFALIIEEHFHGIDRHQRQNVPKKTPNTLNNPPKTSCFPTTGPGPSGEDMGLAVRSAQLRSLSEGAEVGF